MTTTYASFAALAASQGPLTANNCALLLAARMPLCELMAIPGVMEAVCAARADAIGRMQTESVMANMREWLDAKGLVDHQVDVDVIDGDGISWPMVITRHGVVEAKPTTFAEAKAAIAKIAAGEIPLGPVSLLEAPR